MLPSGFPVRGNIRFADAAGRLLLACIIAPVMSLGVAKVSHAEKECPPPCVACNANPKCVWHGNFCFCTLDPDVIVLGDIDVDDPILT